MTPQMVNPDEFLSIKEFAFKLGLHPNTVRRSIKSGRLSAVRIGGGCKAVYRIPCCEINRLALHNLEIIIEKIVEKKKIGNGDKKDDPLE